MLWGTTPIHCPKINSTEALVDCAESLLEQNGYVRPREVIAIVAGTRTKSGSTNFMRLHVMGDAKAESSRHQGPQDLMPTAESKPKRGAAKKPKTFTRYPSPNPPKISNP
jgi:pyruvate kinase